MKVPRLRMRFSLWALAIVALIAVTQIGLSHFSRAQGTNTESVGACTDGIPVWKCTPGEGPTTTTTSPSTSVTTVPPFWPSSAVTPCGSTFFSAAVDAEITSEFGSVSSCFQFPGSNTWVVVSSGTVDGGTASAPGGDVVALETCSGNDSVCADPTSPHDFGNFTVYYPPDPSNWPFQVEATYGNAVLSVGDGSCGQFSFDINSPGWFGPTSTDISSALSGTEPVIFAAPTPTSGATALASAAPSPVSKSCNS